MEERDALKEEATKTKDSDLMREFKSKRNDVKKKLEEDVKVYNEKEFDSTKSSNYVWKSAYKFLGQNNNKAPSQIYHEGNLITSPEKLANAFNQIFLEKVKKIRQKAESQNVKINPVQRLKTWLSQRLSPPSQFKVKALSKVQLRKVMKRMKGGRSHGIDFIDSYSLKVSYPLIEDTILHLVNLSIRKQTFAEVWKVQLVMPLHKKNDRHVGTNYRPHSGGGQDSRIRSI